MIRSAVLLAAFVAGWTAASAFAVGVFLTALARQRRRDDDEAGHFAAVAEITAYTDWDTRELTDR